MFDTRKFKAAMALKGVTLKELAEEIGISYTTLYRKIGNNGSFTREEINEIVKFLDITDPTPIFFADELT